MSHDVPPASRSADVEYLTAGSSRALDASLELRWRRLTSSRPAQVIAVGALVLVGLIVADWVARGLQVQSLMNATRQSLVAMESTQAEFERIALLTPRRPGGLTSAEWEDIHRQFDDVALRGQAEVLAAQESAQGIITAPWHADFAGAREAFITFTTDWRDYVDRARRDSMELAQPRAWYDGDREVLHRQIAQAVPVPDIFSAGDRVESELQATLLPDNRPGDPGTS